MQMPEFHDSSVAKVLYLYACTDEGVDLPAATGAILTTEEAARHFQEMLEDERLPPLQYDPAADTVRAQHLYDDCELTCYGFTPLAGYPELSFEEGNLWWGWRVEINGVVVHYKADDRSVPEPDGQAIEVGSD